VFVGADRPPRAVVIDTSLFWQHHSSDPRTLRDLELNAFVGVYRLWRFMLALHHFHWKQERDGGTILSSPTLLPGKLNLHSQKSPSYCLLTPLMSPKDKKCKIKHFTNGRGSPTKYLSKLIRRFAGTASDAKSVISGGSAFVYCFRSCITLLSGATRFDGTGTAMKKCRVALHLIHY